MRLNCLSSASASSVQCIAEILPIRGCWAVRSRSVEILLLWNGPEGQLQGVLSSDMICLQTVQKHFLPSGYHVALFLWEVLVNQLFSGGQCLEAVFCWSGGSS